jgi:hypothetical protein
MKKHLFWKQINLSRIHVGLLGLNCSTMGFKNYPLHKEQNAILLIIKVIKTK